MYKRALFCVFLSLMACTSSKKEEIVVENNKHTTASLLPITDELDPGLHPLNETSVKGQPAVSTTVRKMPPRERSSYIFKPGDKLKISVWGEDMTENIVVQPDGYISYQLVGDINAAGLTIYSLKEKIELLLSRFIKKPLVSIIPQSFDGNYVTVLGAVTNPGRKVVSKYDRVLDALAQAGGVSMSSENINPGELGTLQKAYLSRDGKLVNVDFAKLVYEGDMSQNVPIKLGDFIYVPSSSNEVVYVTGEVMRPFAMPFRGKPTVMQVLAMAGGISYTGNKSAVYLVRGSISDPMVQRINYSAITRGKAKDVFVRPGDILHVSETAITKIERFAGQIIPFMNAIIATDIAARAVRGSTF